PRSALSGGRLAADLAADPSRPDWHGRPVGGCRLPADRREPCPAGNPRRPVRPRSGGPDRAGPVRCLAGRLCHPEPGGAGPSRDHDPHAALDRSPGRLRARRKQGPAGRLRARRRRRRPCRPVRRAGGAAGPTPRPGAPADPEHRRMGPRARRALLLFAGGGDERRCTVALCRSWVRDGLQLRLPRAIVRTGERTMSSYVWEKSYPPGVKWELEVPRKTIHQIFEESCAQNADRPFTDFLDKVMTFGDYKDATDRAAAGFQKFGVGPGVNVGLYLPNTPHYLIAFFGILKAGGRVVNYSPLDAARELEFKIGDS